MHACMHVFVCMHACVCVCVCVANPVAVELRCHATALISSAGPTWALIWEAAILPLPHMGLDLGGSYTASAPHGP